MLSPTQRVCALALSLAPCASLVAQDVAKLPEAGQRIRVSASALGIAELAGTLVSLGPDTLVIAAAHRQLEIPTSAVTRIDVSRGRKSTAGKGALIGVAGGLLVGGAIGYISCSAAVSPATCFESQEGAQLGFLLMTAGGGALGALTGALVGSSIRRDRWEPMDLSRVRTTLGFAAGGRLILQVSLRYRLPGRPR
jgi:hypothetical protein